jgi:hypothetical protein
MPIQVGDVAAVLHKASRRLHPLKSWAGALSRRIGAGDEAAAGSINPGSSGGPHHPRRLHPAPRLTTHRRLLPRYREVERGEAIARERADQQVVCSVRWDAYGRQARWVKERVVAFAVPSALMVPATTSLRFTGGPHRPRAVGRNQGTLVTTAGGHNRPSTAAVLTSAAIADRARGDPPRHPRTA